MGIGGASKLTALHRLVDFKNPKIVALQETMADMEKAKEALKACLRDWQMETLDAEGHSGGLVKHGVHKCFCIISLHSRMQ